ncbi:MAG: transglutaminase [Methanobrevibacter sp.]|nr:transglutaminase [Methanobrevibacter sp.]
MFFSIVCVLFLLIGSVSAVDSNNVTDNSNLLKENNVVFSTPNMVSSNDSISQTNLANSRDDNLNNYYSGAPVGSSSQNNNVLESQYSSKDGIQVSEVKPTSLVGNDTELYFKNGTSFKVILSDNEGNSLPNQTVIFTINNNNYTRTTNSDGIASIKINLNSGNYNIVSTYVGTSSYGSSSSTNLVKVLPTISGNDIEKYFKNGTQYYATFVNGQGNLLSNTTVTFNINGVYYERKTNENGTAKLNINLNAGEYILTATNPINGEMYSNTVTVLTSIYGFDIVKYYKNDTQYYATFVDATGLPLVNTSVTFNINGVYYTRTTNANGTAKLNINLNPDEYIITAINPVNGELHSNTVQVLPTIFADNLTMYYRNGSKYVANVIDGDGSPLANSTVTFNINGLFYDRITDAEGNARLNINLDVGNYTITAKNEKGLSVSNLITIYRCNSTINGKDTHIISFTDKNYTVKLMGLNNKTISSVPVHFKYTNITVDVVTDENGEATILISNLSEGKYKIEYKFDGNWNYYPSQSYSTLIVANSTVILFADDLNMVYGDGSSFNVTLTDLNEKPIANDTISISINGVAYNRTTDANGIAKLKINLNPGNYTVVYTHSDPDAIDYYVGSNTVNISKRTATFYADDLVLDAGEKGVFKATLLYNKDPLENMVVTFNINGILYDRVTDKNGTAKLNVGLEVGYYPITVSINNTFYEAKPLSKHILVNGTILTGKDLNMVVGTSANFEVSLKDPYGKPISNASIEFKYAQNTITKNTNSNGIASIIISNLSKGDYPIVYTYVGGNNSAMSFIHVVGTVPISQLVSAANYVNSYIEKNAKLPTSVSIGEVSYSTAQYLYLLSEAIVNINGGDLSNLYVLSVNNPTNPGSASNMGNLNEYVSVANYLITSMDNGNTPNYVSTSIGNVGYDGLVYAFTRVLVYYGEMNKLPSTVAVKSLKIYESTSVLDSVNTITDLSAYLSPSTHCQSNNAEIVALAERLTQGLTTSVEKATAIYNYVRDKISYSFYYDTNYGAVGTLHSGSGNCVDQAHLVIALYRAANLPARYVHGTCVFSSGGTYGHVWAQVLIGDTWIVTDPTSTRNSFDKVVNWNNYNYVLKGYFPSISF